jgi:hypothetical protein
MNSNAEPSPGGAVTEWQRFDTATMLIVYLAESNSFASGWLEFGAMFNFEQGSDLRFTIYDLRD